MLAPMADESSSSETVPAPPEAAAPEGPTAEPKLEIGLPVDMFVKDGTRTWASEMYEKQQFAAAEARRDQAARERQVAKQENKPEEGSIATLRTNRLSPNQGIPAGYVGLIVCNRQGQPITGSGSTEPEQVACEVVMSDDALHPDDLVLMICCPHCVYDLGVHQGDAQIKVSQRQRGWHLDARAEHQQPIVGDFFNDATQRLEHVSLPRMGMVTDSDRIPCPRCSWVYRIDKNRLWPV